jgi:alpha-1,2-mannosyltransferase
MFIEYIAGIVSLVVCAGILAEMLPRYAGVSLSGSLGSSDDSVVSHLGQHANDRPIFVVCSIAVCVFLLLYPFLDAVMRVAEIAAPFGYWDFGAYTGALHRWLTGEAIYVTNENGGYFGTYLYPPLFLLVIWPFFEMGFYTGAILWQVCSVLFLWFALQLVIGALGHHLRLWERGLFLWALVGFHPVLFSVKQGQVSAFIGGLLTLALYGLLRGKNESGNLAQYCSGGVTAVAGVVKVVYAPVGTHLLIDRDRFLGAIGGAIAVLGVSVAVFGLDAHLDYIEILVWGKHNSARSPLLWMQTYYQPFYAISSIALPLRILGSLAVAALAIAATPNDVDREIFALGVAALPLLAPRVYNYYLTALLPAVLVMLAVELERDGRPLLPVISLFLLHIHSYGLKLVVEYVPDLLPYPSEIVPGIDITVAALVTSLFQPGVWGVLLLAGLAGIRVANAATTPVWISNALENP